jgi:hypothetical protein
MEMPWYLTSQRRWGRFENTEVDIQPTGYTGVSKIVLLAALHGTLRLCKLGGSTHLHRLHITTYTRSQHPDIIQEQDIGVPW